MNEELNKKCNFRILNSKNDLRFIYTLDVQNQNFIDNTNISQILLNIDTDNFKLEVDIWRQFYILEVDSERVGYASIRYYPAERSATFTYCISEEYRGNGYGKFLLQKVIQTIKISKFADGIEVKVMEKNLISQYLLDRAKFRRYGCVPNARQLMPDGTILTQDYYIYYLNID